MTSTVTWVRRAANIGLVLVAALQGLTYRHAVSPDGIAYLDLSDAVVAGRPADLVNAYWSPLYPFLVGLARLAASPTRFGAPYWEFALLHVVSFVGFVLALLAFGWFLRALDAESADWADSWRPFASPGGLAAAYLLFGVTMLGMISVAGTVPDFFLAAALLAAFASALQLRTDVADHRSAIRLGLALGLAALTKSIAFPIAFVVLLSLALVVWRRGGRGAVVRAGSVFAVTTLPWVLALSLAEGRPTFGRTGALNYAWYVNEQQPPNEGHLPALAIARDSLPVSGIALMPGARGTNPLWLEPARWHADVRPRWSAAQQWKRLAGSLRYYVFITAPLLMVLAGVGAAATWRQVALTVRRASPVLLPCVAALGAYALVYTLSRHIAVFVLAGCLAIAGAFPRGAGFRIARFSVGFAVALFAIAMLAPEQVRSMVTVAQAFGLFTLGWVWFARASTPLRWTASVAAVLLLWVLQPVLPGFAFVLPSLIALGLWLGLRRGDFEGAPERATRLRATLAIAAVCSLAVPPLARGLAAIPRWSAPPGDAHPAFAAADRLTRAGVAQGSKIAVLGDPGSAAWARMGRFQIVAVVPDTRVHGVEQLSGTERARMMRAFSRAGATHVVARPPSREPVVP